MDYSCYNYIFRGFILITQFLGGKRGNLKLISGLLLPSFILNYILIERKRVGIRKFENTREGENERTGREEEQSFENLLA